MANELTKIPKFRRCVLQNFPFIEKDFDALTDYQLLCKVVEYLNKVIDSQNDVIEITESLTSAFNELQSFVENYFESLDVQEEINNKLDEMVTDGTFASIIEPYLEQFEQEIRSDITNLQNSVGDISKLETVKKDNLTNAVNSANENYIYLMRKKYGRHYRNFNIPINDNWYSKVHIYKDIKNNNYSYQFIKENYKLTGGNTYYVDPSNTEAGSAQDGSAEHPYSTLQRAIVTNTNLNNNDTIIFKAGIYGRASVDLNHGATGNKLTKSVNIIAEDGVILNTQDKLTFTQVDNTNVYQAARSGVVNVIDIRKSINGDYPYLTKTSTLEECGLTPYSWAVVGPTLYVNLNGEVVDNTKVICPLLLGASMNCIPVETNGSDVTIYLENIVSVGEGTAGIFGFTNNSSTYNLNVIANNCKFIGSRLNAASFIGTNSILHKCEALYARRDGFNYHAGGKKCNAIELDCIGAYNGIEDAGNNYNNNGSTTHDGNTIVRVNCKCFNNVGPNIADVNDNTISVNLGCIAFDSDAIYGQKVDFMTTDTATMYLYNCYAKGSRSNVNIKVTGSEAVTHLNNNTLYDTSDISGTIIND